MKRALLVLALLCLPGVARAQEFSCAFESDPGGTKNFCFDGKGPNPTIPSGRTIDWLPTGGWNSTGGAQITVNGCTSDCSSATNQGDIGWYASTLGGSYTAGTSKKYGRFRIRLDSPFARGSTKFTDFGQVNTSRVIAKLGLPYDTNVGCHPSGEGNDFFGVTVSDTDPTTAWQRATGAESFSLGARFQDFDLGTVGASSSRSNYAMWTIGSGISFNCAQGFAILPYYTAVGDIQPQNNAAASQHGWVHIQYEVISGAACGADSGGYKVWVNNNTYASPTFQALNVNVAGSESVCPIGVVNWNGQYVFGGTWGQSGTSATVFTVDDVEFSDSFDSSYYELESGAAADPGPRHRRPNWHRAELDTIPVERERAPSSIAR